jgi:hypothetical protein
MLRDDQPAMTVMAKPDTNGAMSKSWEPLLTGTEAAAAAAAVADIEAALRTVETPRVESGAPSPSLGSGDAGIALFSTYLALAAGAAGEGAELFGATAEGHAERASQLLERAADALAGMPLGPGLYAGFPGVAWAIEHAGRQLSQDGGEETGADGAEDFNQPVDEALLPPLARSPWPHDFDLMRGLVGMGVYALERADRPSAAACLVEIVERLGELAERGPEGTTWFTRPELLPDWQRETRPDGLYNLGISHGVPGVIALLAATAGFAPTARASRELLDGAIPWLLAQRLPAESGSSFGYSVEDRPVVTGARLAWCYGDPGIAAALLPAARAAGNAEWEEAALTVARRAARRGVEGSAIRDAGLCHGAAGLGHVFHRLHRATGDPELAQAARFWLGHALTLRRPGEGIAGFAAWRTEADGVEKTWENDPGFLEGSAGIGLALLAAISPVEPAWDRVLLLSTAPPPAP